MWQRKSISQEYGLFDLSSALCLSMHDIERIVSAQNRWGNDSRGARNKHVKELRTSCAAYRLINIFCY
jgi:hypothetical protein